MINNIDERIIDPTASIWISANAGTGKTKNLIDRILCLLFQGVEPKKIICLTYTNAAAHEMLDRLSLQIEELNNENLQEKYISISKENNKLIKIKILDLFPKLKEKDFIKQLYEKSNSANWVNIQTIHSFCFSIIKQMITVQDSQEKNHFLPKIELCDDQIKKQLLQDAINKTLNNHIYNNELTEIMNYTNDFYNLFIDNFSDISRFIYEHDNLEEYFLQNWNLNKQDINTSDKENITLLFKDIFKNQHKEIFKNLAEKLNQGGISDKKTAKILSEQINNPNENFIDAFLTENKEIKKRLCSKSIENIALQDLETNAEKALLFFKKLNKIRLVKSNIAFFQISKIILQEYRDLKTLYHFIDFDDVIIFATALLKHLPLLMFKIDSNIEHVLLDEAQDTSPDQWEIIKLITQEFFDNYQSGKTLFVVGDEKQSIYSFQGSDVEYFKKMHVYFQQIITNSGAVFKNIELSKSYRTSTNILNFVDLVFKNKFKCHHESARNSLSTVKVFSPYEHDSNKTTLPEIILAKNIANTINNHLKNNTFVPSKNRSIEPSDFMILFRKRDFNLITAIRKELKKLDIPVAEIDQVKLNEELAVEDLICLAKFVLLPEDDLMFARLLKSSIIGISEQELMNICMERNDKTLWEQIQHTELYKKYNLENLQKYISYRNLSPYNFFSKILNDGIFEKMIEQLGTIYINSIFEFINLTVKFSNLHSPILQDFINWFDTTDINLKRNISNKNNEVQLITAHGSKGLQAPFVIIANAYTNMDSSQSIIKINEEIIWKSINKFNFGIIKDINIIKKQKENEEAERLLYVALTRAEDFLYIFGIKPAKDNTWYNLLENFFEENTENEMSISQDYINEINKTNKKRFIPAQWFFEKLPIPIENEKNNSEEIEYGNYVHEILAIPYIDRKNKLYFQQTIKKISKKFDLSQELKEKAENEAISVLKTFNYMFNENSLSELEVLFENHNLRIDKIYFNENFLWIIDFKTGQPENSLKKYKNQLDLYCKAIKASHKFDDYIIKKAILWTKNLTLEEF